MAFVACGYIWWSTVAIILQLATIPIIAIYNPSHDHRETQVRSQALLYFLPRAPSLPIHDPTPATFAASSLLYTASALLFYHLHNEDRCQRLIVGAGFGLGLLVPQLFMAGQNSVRIYVPSCVTFAMLLSAIGHQFQRRTAMKSKVASEEKLDNTLRYAEKGNHTSP